METTITKIWKTEEELIQEFYQLQAELESAYGQELQLIVEEDENELIIGFSTRMEGMTFEITTIYRITQGQGGTIYEKVKPNWYASRSGRFIGHEGIESADEAIRVVIASMEILAEIDLDVEEEKPTLERNRIIENERFDDLLSEVVILRELLYQEQEKSNQSRFVQTKNQWFDNGKYKAYQNAVERIDEIIKEFA